MNTQSERPRRAIAWFRRDLRLDDNAALRAADADADEVVPLFVRDPRLRPAGPANRFRDRRLDAALVALDAEARAIGGRLIVREGRAEDVVPAVAREVGANVVHAHREYTPFGTRRDATIGSAVDLRLHPGVLLREPEAVGDYRVFGPFFRAWTAVPVRTPLDRPRRLRVPDDIPSANLPEVEAMGERAAVDRARRWAASSADAYAASRDRLDGDGTSRLSADLHFGTLSVARLHELVDAPEFRRQLAWRDWAHHALALHPAFARDGWWERRRDVAWRTDPEAVQAWCAGRTGYPAVDAAMRQLAAEGWISNRARLIVASFLTKHLLVDWRVGERHFLDRLVDADVANNNLGWQWSAGVGGDRAPYVRVLNPVLQGERWDPEGVWIRRWLPELHDLPTPFVHRPWAAGLIAPSGYPDRMLDHAFAVQRARAAYASAGGG